MGSWTADTFGHERVYRRPLGLTESTFYYDSQISGVSDTVQHAEVEISHEGDRHLFSEDNMLRSWSLMKRQFPLLGARLERGHDNKVYFAIVENRLQKASKINEVLFDVCSSSQDARAFILDLLNGPRVLDDNHTARVYILRPSGTYPRSFHIILHAAHCIADVLGGMALLKSFLQTMVDPEYPATVVPLHDRLQLAVPIEMLTSTSKLDITRQRWHLLIASAVQSNRRRCIQGGHTLPRRGLSETSTPVGQAAARSQSLDISLPVVLSQTILKTCRARQITLGAAQPILAQVALTRFLCRRYLRGDITQEEWDFRKREPTFSAGPINVRPRLDEQWLKQGGGENVSLGIRFFVAKLPFMPLGSATGLKPGDELPTYEQLLSPERFFLRTRSVKKQMMDAVLHPLFLDLGAADLRPLLETRTAASAEWQKRSKSPPSNFTVGGKTEAEGKQDPDQPASRRALAYKPIHPFIPLYGGSALGDLDRMLPHEYLIRSTVSTAAADEPKVKLLSTHTYLRCRPSELYLGTMSFRGRLHFLVLWDEITFEKTVIEEWLDEVMFAAEVYLGGGLSIKHGGSVAALSERQQAKL